MIRCPFHDDANPSMRITEHSARCYAGCLGEDWLDEIAFVMKMEGAGFAAALHLMAQRLNIPTEGDEVYSTSGLSSARGTGQPAPAPITRDDVYRELVLSSTAIHDHLLCVPPDQFEEHLYLANRIADLLSRHCPFPHCDLPALLASARRIREGLSQYWVDEELPGETCQLRWWGR
jgi:hypothetical protein